MHRRKRRCCIITTILSDGYVNDVVFVYVDVPRALGPARPDVEVWVVPITGLKIILPIFRASAGARRRPRRRIRLRIEDPQSLPSDIALQNHSEPAGAGAPAFELCSSAHLYP